MSLRYQINLHILSMSLVILLLGGAAVIWQAREAVSKEIASSLNLAASLIQFTISGSPDGSVDLGSWLPRFVALEQTRHLRIQLQKADGEAVSFTGTSKPKMAKNRPPQWFIGLVSSQYPPIRQDLAIVGGTAITLLIEADPLDEMSEAWEESQSFFLSLFGLALLTILAANLVFNRAFRAIAQIEGSLQAIEQGQYEKKLPLFKTQEFARIAKAINQLIDVLEHTRRDNAALALHSLTIQENERRRLSQELHDELGQSLTAIKVMAVTLQKPQADKTQISAEIIRICDHLHIIVRSMMRQLHPLVLDELGLKAGLEDLLGHWQSRHPGLVLDLTCPDQVNSLDSAIAIQIYRVVQECLTNVVRHANASYAKVSLAFLPEGLLSLEVLDNGEGYQQPADKKGFGLLGMQERIKNLGGAMEIQNLPRQGMGICATIPLA